MTRSGSGWPGGVQVLGDVLDVEDLGQFLDRGAAGGVVLQQRPDRVGDLAPAAVADGDVDQQAGVPAVASAASFSTCAVSAGSRSSAPTGLTCQSWATSSGRSPR